MKILGNRILVSRIKEEEVKEGEFEKVQVQDDFLYKGKVEQIGVESEYNGTSVARPIIERENVVLFAKYSPHTQSVTVEGEEMKVVRMEDVIAIV